MINNNGEITKELKEGLGLSELTGYPRRIGDAILPTFETNPELQKKSIILAAATSSLTGTLTGLNTTSNPLTKRTFLTGLFFVYDKDVLCDAATGFLTIDIQTKGKGAVQAFAIPITTLTAEKGNFFLQFNQPLELEPATNLTCTKVFTVGSLSRSITLMGYQIDDLGR